MQQCIQLCWSGLGEAFCSSFLLTGSGGRSLDTSVEKELSLEKVQALPTKQELLVFICGANSAA